LSAKLALSDRGPEGPESEALKAKRKKKKSMQLTLDNRKAP
jgi:hypothetical protein